VRWRSVPLSSVAKFFTSRTLTGQQNSPLSDSAMVEVTDDKIFVVTVRFDNKDVSRYKVPSMRTDPVVVSSRLGERILRQVPCGRWAATASWATLLSLIDQVGEAVLLRRVLFARFRSSEFFRQLGCDCNCGCTLPHADNVSSIYGCSSVRALDL